MTSESAAEARVRSAVSACMDRAIDRIEWIPAGIGLRRFARVRLAGTAAPTSIIARVDAPEDPAGRPAGLPPEPPLEPLRALLERNGLPVPLHYGSHGGAGGGSGRAAGGRGRAGGGRGRAAGGSGGTGGGRDGAGDMQGRVELLEDLGSVSLEAAVQAATPAERRALYVEACDLIPRLQAIQEAPGVEAFHRHFESAHFAYKADLFIEWSLASRGRAASAAERAIVRDAFARIADVVRAAPVRLAHRDFQSANLHVTTTRSAPHLVMIDLQGALMAPPEYDLVCLLRDSYVELGAAELDYHLERALARLPEAVDRDTFALRFDLMTLTRKGKDHARFLYAANRRSDERFLAGIPVTCRYLQRAAARSAERDPRFTDLAELISTLPDAHSDSRSEPLCAG